MTSAIAASFKRKVVGFTDVTCWEPVSTSLELDNDEMAYFWS